MFDFEHYLNTWSCLWILFVCCLPFFIWIFLDKLKNIVLYINALTGNHQKEFVGKNSSEASCTSLSCVRCSNSIFSTEKLLKKWSVIQKAFLPEQDISCRIENAIIRQGNSKENAGENRAKYIENQAPTVFYMESLPAKIWYSEQDYPKEVSILETASNLDIIISEFLVISQDLDVGWASNQVASGGWHLFHLFNQGVRLEENCKRCPQTTKIIEELPLFMSNCAFGNVMFSVLLPDTVIDSHCGPTNVRIRCHLPLKAPEGYFICIAGQERSWKENNVLIFDDSFYHEVYHRGNMLEARVVLMIDFWHPGLSFEEKQIITTLFSPQ